MSRVDALIYLGLSGQDFGPCYTDEWTHAQFAAMWRGTVPCPTEEEIETAKVLIPALSAIATPLQFIERFTGEEQLSIVTAAMTTPALRLWYDKLMAAQEVVFNDPRLSAGLDALVTAGLITAERKSELLLP